MNKALHFILVFVTVSLVSAQQPSSPWPARLLEKPFHVGDDKDKQMRNPSPDGPRFLARFDLPPTIQPGIASFVYVTIRAGGLLPANDKKYAKAFKDGQMLSRLYINGKEVAVLNQLMRGPEAIANVQNLKVRVSGTFLRPGFNELEIRPGANSKNLDDFELHEVVVGTKPQ